MKILIFYSGGKDSQASLIWAIKEYGLDNCEAVFCDTGWENPVTYEHIIETTKQLGVKLVILKSKKYDGMVDLAVKKKRFASTKARFCTEELKSKPAIDYVLSHKEHLLVIEGIRANESKARSKMAKECTYFKYYFEPIGIDKKGKPKYHTYRKKDILKWCKEYNADKLRPLFNWTAQQVVDYIIENGQQPNLLYYNGFTRVGCFPCIMARHGEVKRIMDNYPEQFNRLKDAEMKVGRTFFPPDYIPKHACKNRKYPFVSDVEKYLNDKNNTLDMFEEETPSCMSAYNLCE
jgi:3'-phosphoadenosine 5'-phosphosulfate sulfotransferase (PAPS reductase)/FAD synthetase